jgi:hypothetical protein
MTDPRDLIKRLADELDHYRQLLMGDGRETHALANEARAYLDQPEPTLTVQDCKDMSKHWDNFITEDYPGEIILDGCFTREDLIEIANTVPTTEV